MTYQQQFLSDRHARIATQIGHAEGKPAEWMHSTAHLLAAQDFKREEIKGKLMTDDHLKQAAVKLARGS